MTATILSAAAIAVRYGATTALDGVDVDVRRGEIHAIVGENGAGKSTLLRVLAGAELPRSGTVTLAPGAQVAWVPQEAVLPADLDAAAWILLAVELRGPLGPLRRRAMRDQAAKALQAVGCHAAPAARLGALTVSQRKQVQLARALRGQLEGLLLDEPTPVLGAAEAARLFAAVRELARGGAAVIYVSHRLEEVLGLADRVTVLRDGRRVMTRSASDVDQHDLVRAMVGRGVPAGAAQTHLAPPWGGRAGPAGRPPAAAAPLPGAAPAIPVLAVRDVAVGHVHGVSFAVRAGEIVGLAGLVGSGRR